MRREIFPTACGVYPCLVPVGLGVQPRRIDVRRRSEHVWNAAADDEVKRMCAWRYIAEHVPAESVRPGSPDAIQYHHGIRYPGQRRFVAPYPCCVEKYDALQVAAGWTQNVGNIHKSRTKPSTEDRHTNEADVRYA